MHICNSALLAKFPDCRELRCQRRQLRLDRSDFLLVLSLGTGFFGALDGLGCLGFIEIMATNGGICEHRYNFRLHFKNSACDKYELFFATCRFDAHRTRLDAGDQRRVLRINAEFARFTRENHEFRFARVDALLGADDVYM